MPVLSNGPKSLTKNLLLENLGQLRNLNMGLGHSMVLFFNDIYSS